MSIFDKWRAKSGKNVQTTKQDQKNANEQNDSQEETWRKTAEELLNNGHYDRQSSAKIYDALTKANISHFIENPTESGLAKISFCVIPITQNGVTTRWLSVFTSSDNMKLIRNEPFLVTEAKMFSQTVQECLNNTTLAGIIVNPKVHNLLLPREFIAEIEGGRRLLENNRPKLERLAELISSPNRAESSVRNEIAELLFNAHLPIAMINTPDGKLFPADIKVNSGEKTLIAFFSSDDSLTATARAIGAANYEISYMRGGVLELIKKGINWGTEQPVIDPIPGGGYLIDQELCAMILEKASQPK